MNPGLYACLHEIMYTGCGANLRGLRQTSWLSKVVGAENFCSPLALSSNQLRCVDLCKALINQRLAKELTHSALNLHYRLVGRYTQIKPPGGSRCVSPATKVMIFALKFVFSNDM